MSEAATTLPERVRGRPVPAPGRIAAAAALVGAAALAVQCALVEGETAFLEAHLLSALARSTTYRVEPGPSEAIAFPRAGPYDLRLGYARVPEFVERLRANGFRVEEQARLSPQALALARAGLRPPHREKAAAGLEILDRRGRALFAATYPAGTYSGFEAVPWPVVDALLFVENRELLAADRPSLNPAIEWDRFGRAVLHYARHELGLGGAVPGGSTLATQMEKYRHSPGGITGSPVEKLRQIASASLSAYRDGPGTLEARRAIVADYLNSIPLAAVAGEGEVIGLGSGLEAWYGADFEAVKAELRALGEDGSRPSEAQARAYRQVLSLLLAARRPTYYLIGDPAGLAARTDGYLRLLAASGRISPELRDRALAVRLEPPGAGPRNRPPAQTGNRPYDPARTRLAALLGVSAYELDRFDLVAQSSLDRHAQEAATRILRELRDPRRAAAAGLRAPRLLDRGDPSGVVYALTLYERTPGLDLLRVQADNLEQPLDVNEGTKLDLGSTAKLRTLATYLELVAELHERFSRRSREELRRIEVDPSDRLGRFVVDQLRAEPALGLPALLDEAMARRYSASPGERFFTGGGVHTFANFRREDNGRVMSVREAFRDSVNLVFVRLMRDIVHHHLFASPERARLLRDPDDPTRQELLRRFADREGRVFLQRFRRELERGGSKPLLDRVSEGVRLSPLRLAVLVRSLRPEASFEEFAAEMRARLRGSARSERKLRELYEAHAPGRFSLSDRGYLARVHPLELWLAAYLERHPQASQAEVEAASVQERIDVYRWLFSPRRRKAQDLRIRTLLEIEAFEAIHEQWRRLGYPFETLVPSYATAIGASADRPAALAELVGIIAGGGVRAPTARILELRFGEGTPYETSLVRPPGEGRRVLRPEVAEALRHALVETVERGTARRAFHALRAADGGFLEIGGKTGTGDHRLKRFAPGARLLEARPVNRTATFAFLIGDRYYGVVTAYVAGPRAARYRFTSALPVQIFKQVAPELLAALGEPLAAPTGG
jgi:membrane peptidoglycan carboxypeptidase